MTAENIETMTKEQKDRLSEILSNVEYYLYNEMDVISDDDFCNQTQDLLAEVKEGIEILCKSSQ